eukprot:312483_1
MATIAVAADPAVNTPATATHVPSPSNTATNGTHLVIPTPADEDRFLQLLKELAFNGAEPVFHSKSKWQDLCTIDSFKNDARFKPFDCDEFEQIAHDQFEKFCWNISDQLAQPKQQLKQILKASNHTISPDDTVTHLMTVFSQTLRTKPIAESPHLRLLFAEMIAKQQYLSNKRQNQTNASHHRHRERLDSKKKVKLSSFDHSDNTRTKRRETRKTYVKDHVHIHRDRHDRDRNNRRKDHRDRDRERITARSKSPHRDHETKKKEVGAGGSNKSYPTLPPQIGRAH